MSNFLKVDINCRFCGEKTGDVEVDLAKVPEGEEPAPKHADVAESRCQSCVDTHGTLQQAEKLYYEKVNESREDFLTLYEQAGFNLAQLEVKCDEKIAAAEQAAAAEAAVAEVAIEK